MTHHTMVIYNGDNYEVLIYFSSCHGHNNIHGMLSSERSYGRVYHGSSVHGIYTTTYNRNA